MNDHSAGHVELPRSAYLEQTLRRAWSAAQQRSHRYVTLEHLLLALLDDPDSIELLQAVDADIPLIQGSVATALNNSAALVAPGGKPPAFSYKFDNLFTSAFEHATSAGRKEIDGAFLLVALAKHPESDASAILAANGFNAQVAQRTLDALLNPSPPPPAASQTPPPGTPRSGKPAKPKPNAQRPQTPPRPAAAPNTKLAGARQGGGAGSGDRFMEDMLASVRNILDSENRKDWALAPLLNPAATSPAPGSKRVPPRVEPQLPAGAAKDAQRPPAPAPGQASNQPQERARPLQLRAEAAKDVQRPLVPPPGQAPHQSLERASPPPRPPIVSSALRPAVPAPPPAFSEPEAEIFDLELPLPPAQEHPQERPQERPREKKRKGPGPKPSRAQNAPPEALLKTLENIPRSLRLARGEIVKIRLGKEEAGQLFVRTAQHPQQGREAQNATRAVSIRLSAPEGGFFIETMTPETQWLSDRANSPGEEPFGNWSWAVVPNETGWRILLISFCVRDIDASGALNGSQVTEQALKIRVGTNFGRLFWGSVRALLLLIAGGALAVGAWYVLKTTGRLPF